jgi:hypothetical protein
MMNASGYPEAYLRPYGGQLVGTLRPPRDYPEATLRLSSLLMAKRLSPKGAPGLPTTPLKQSQKGIANPR